MRPVKVQGPVYEEVAVEEPPAEASPGEEGVPMGVPEVEPPPPPPAPPKPEERRLPSASGGLDDLFGMPMEGRISFRKKKPPEGG